MMSETSFLRDVLRGREWARETVEELDRGKEPIFLLSPALFELWEGAGLAFRAVDEIRRVEALARSYEVLPFDQADAKAAGLLQARLARTGKRMGTVDIAIAGMALARHQALVTGDRDFSAVAHLVRVSSSR